MVFLLIVQLPLPLPLLTMTLTRRSSLARFVALTVLGAALVAVPWHWWATQQAQAWLQQVWRGGQALVQTLDASGLRASQAVERAAQANRRRADDAAISSGVMDALAAAQSDDLRALQVDTRHAMVTLRGTVSSWQLQQRAVAIASSAPGVLGVLSQIAVPVSAQS